MPESKPFSFDKEKIANQVESIMNELIPRLTRKNYRYKLGKKQRKKLYDVLSLQEQHYNLDYKHMNKEEERKNLIQFSDEFDFPDESDFMHDTNFKSYRNTLFSIVDKNLR